MTFFVREASFYCKLLFFKMGTVTKQSFKLQIWDNKMPEEEVSVMSYKKKNQVGFFSFPTISNHLTPGHTLPGNEDIVGNRDLERCPKGVGGNT